MVQSCSPPAKVSSSLLSLEYHQVTLSNSPCILSVIDPLKAFIRAIMITAGIVVTLNEKSQASIGNSRWLTKWVSMFVRYRRKSRLFDRTH
jgi:hypothetical protein